jgi:hypothetical protein
MLLVMGFAYMATARAEIGRYLGVLLILATFVDFNTVFYLQYMAWVVPFIVLASLDRGLSGRIGPEMPVRGQGMSVEAKPQCAQRSADEVPGHEREH